MSEKVKVATGDIDIRNKTYFFEFWSDNTNHFVKVFSNDGKEVEFMRNPKNNLRNDMEAALITNGIIIGEGRKKARHCMPGLTVTHLKKLT